MLRFLQLVFSRPGPVGGFVANFRDPLLVTRPHRCTAWCQLWHAGWATTNGEDLPDVYAGVPSRDMGGVPAARCFQCGGVADLRPCRDSDPAHFVCGSCLDVGTGCVA